MMPDELAFEFRQLDVRVIQLGYDFKTSVVAEQTEFLAHIDRFHVAPPPLEDRRSLATRASGEIRSGVIQRCIQRRGVSAGELTRTLASEAHSEAAVSSDFRIHARRSPALFQALVHRTLRHVEKAQFVPRRVSQNSAPAYLNLKRGYNNRPARSLKRRDRGAHVVHQVVDAAVARDVWIVMQNDLCVCLRHPKRDRVLVGPKGFQTQRPLIELARRREVVHPEHHAVYFSKKTHRPRPGATLLILQRIGGPPRHRQAGKNGTCDSLP